jgi:hypothetical protein
VIELASKEDERIPSEALHGHFLEIPFHIQLQKVKVGRLIEISRPGKRLPPWNENFNKNYRLPLEKLYGRRILENHDFRKKQTKYSFNIFSK